MFWLQAVPCKQGGHAQREPLVRQQPRGEIHCNSELGAALVDRRGGSNGFVEHEVGELADSVMLFGCGYELGGCDRALLRVRPACERFGTDDLARAEIEL